MDYDYTLQHQLCMSLGVLQWIFPKKILTWAGTTSTSFIPSPSMLPHLWKKSAMPQLKCSLKKWNSEQQLPTGKPKWATFSLETGHTTSLDSEKRNPSWHTRKLFHCLHIQAAMKKDWETEDWRCFLYLKSRRPKRQSNIVTLVVKVYLWFQVLSKACSVKDKLNW